VPNVTAINLPASGREETLPQNKAKGGASEASRRSLWRRFFFEIIG